MKRTLITSLTACLTIFCYAQPELDWAFGIGGTGYDTPANSIATDADGNVYIAGYFYGEVDFDPSVQTEYLTGTEDFTDSFFAKYDADGGLVYVKHIKGGGAVDVADLALDNEGNIYITGSFFNEIDFNPSISASAYIASYSYSFHYIAKYNNDGNFLFVKRSARPVTNFSYAGIKGLAVDSEQNIYVTGFFEGTVDFHSQEGEEAILNNESDASNVFLAKYDQYGNYVSVRNIVRSDEFATANSITIDSNDDVIVAGMFNGTADFNPSPLFQSNMTTQGNGDAFVAKYNGVNSLSGLIFANRIGGTGEDRANDVAVDSEGAVYVAGTFSGSVEFGDNGNSVPSAGSTDIFYCKYDANGDFDYVQALGGTGSDKVNSIMIDGEGTVYVTGMFSGSVDFNPITLLNQVDIYTSAGGRDVFLAKYSATLGWYLGGYHMGGVNDDEALGMAADAEGNIIITGTFKGTADFGIEGTSEILNNSSTYSTDIFLAKYAFDFVAVDESVLESAQVTLYPNPTSGDLTLMFNRSHGYDHANVLDVSGKLVSSHQLNEGQLSKRIDVADLSSGIYAIQFIGSTGHDTFKFIKE